MEKKCSKCKEVKGFECFSKNRSRRDGLQRWCKACTRNYTQEYYEANRDRCLEQKREYHEANRDRILEYKRKHHEANRDRLLEYQREYREAFPERRGFCDFCKRIGKSTEEVLEEYNMTREEIWDETREFYVEAQRLTKETGEPHHVDHIKPLCEGGEHRAYNLQVLTGSENQSKGGHWTQADDDLTDEDIERLDQEALAFSQTLTLA